MFYFMCLGGVPEALRSEVRSQEVTAPPIIPGKVKKSWKGNLHIASEETAACSACVTVLPGSFLQRVCSCNVACKHIHVDTGCSLLLNVNTYPVNSKLQGNANSKIDFHRSLGCISLFIILMYNYVYDSCKSCTGTGTLYVHPSLNSLLYFSYCSQQRQIKPLYFLKYQLFCPFLSTEEQCLLICGTLFLSWLLMKAYYRGTSAPGYSSASSTWV